MRRLTLFDRTRCFVLSRIRIEEEDEEELIFNGLDSEGTVNHNRKLSFNAPPIILGRHAVLPFS